MGASAWSYFTPYKDNVQESLDELRQKVFSEGKYYRPDFSDLPETFEEWVKQDNLKVPKDKVESWKEDFYAMKRESNKIPQSIEELIELNQESGTHSIIDITEISNKTSEDESGTLSREDLIRIFGTDMPTRKMVEKKADHLLDFRGRWLCTYIVVYKEDRPDEFFFTGFSGD